MAGLLLTFLISCQNEATEKVAKEESAVVAHHRREQLIAACMDKAGFVYQPIPYYERVAGDPYVSYLQLSDADSVGYHGVKSAILIAATSRGEPESTLTAVQTERYVAALHGLTDESGEPAQDAPSSGGCRGAALAEVPASSAADDSRAFVEFYEELTTTDEYHEFNLNWRECIKNAGFEPQASTVFEHFYTAEADFTERAFTVIGEKVTKDVTVSVVNDQLFSSVFDMLPPLKDLFEEERQLATADQICREQAWPVIETTAKQIFEQAFGRPLPDS